MLILMDIKLNCFYKSKNIEQILYISKLRNYQFLSNNGMDTLSLSTDNYDFCCFVKSIELFIY